MPGGRRRAREVLEAPLRRPRLVLGAVIVGLLGALAASWLVPHRYRASVHIRAQWADEAGWLGRTESAPCPQR